jgi:hypothetical protein
MTDQPEALRLADELDDLNAGRNYDTPLTEAAAELRRLHVANAELTECLEKKSIAIQRIWKERDELRAEVERLRKVAGKALAYMESVGKMDMYPDEYAIVESIRAALKETK